MELELDTYVSREIKTGSDSRWPREWEIATHLELRSAIEKRNRCKEAELVATLDRFELPAG